MLKTWVVWLAVLSLAIEDCLANDAQPAQHVDILVIFAYSANTPSYSLILDGIRHHVTEEFGNGYNLHTEYLQQDYLPRNDLEAYLGLINEKYRKIGLDILICVGMDAVSMVKEYADEYLLNLPAINLDFDLSGYGITMDRYLNGQTAYIGLKFDPARTITSALELFPESETAYFICGQSTRDSVYQVATRRALKDRFPGLDTAFITDFSLEELLKEVRYLPQNSLIFIASVTFDADGLPLNNSEAIRLISRDANVPVFSYTDLGFSEGSVGGMILSFREAGLIAGEAAVRILKGADPNSIVISDEEYYRCQYDWRQLVKWGRDESGIKGEHCAVLYRETDFFERYRWIFIGGILFIFLQIILIMSLVRMYRRQKTMIRQIQETGIRFREFVDEDRILMLAQMTASLSHELMQPLTAILSTAQAGMRFVESGKYDLPLLKEILGNIIEEDKRTASILRSIMGMMKLEERQKERVDLNTLVSETLELFETRRKTDDLRTVLNLADRQVWVIADKVQLQQVILNLLQNARQAFENLDMINKTITVSVSHDNGNATVSVSDNGMGLDQSIRPRLFKPFVTSREKGLGIGLAICRTIVEEHQGKIWAEDSPGGGATFSFTLNSVS